MKRGSSTVSEAGESNISPTADAVGEPPDDKLESEGVAPIYDSMSMEELLFEDERET